MKPPYTHDATVKQVQIKPSVTSNIVFKQKARSFTKLAERSPQQTDLDFLYVANAHETFQSDSKKTPAQILNQIYFIDVLVILIALAFVFFGIAAISSCIYSFL